MNIEFCDICGESVPVGDLSEGGAKRFGERVVCKRCDEAMTRHVAPAAALSSGDAGGRAATSNPGGAHPGEGSGALWLAGACVAVVALIGYLSVDRVRDAENRVQSDVAGQMVHLENRIAGLEHLLRHSVAPAFEQDDDAARFDALAARLEGIEAELGSGLDPELLLNDLDQLSIDVRGLHEIVQRGDGDDARMEALAADVATLRDDLSLLARSMLEALEETPAAVAPPAEVRREAAEAQPDWLAFVGGLSSDDDGERWNAVEELGASGDPAAADYVVPMLRDDELFVRMAAARVLGDLGNDVAVSALVDALDDVEPSVRESAVLSLRLLTGRSFDFDPNGEVRDRTRAAKKWRDWWAEESATD